MQVKEEKVKKTAEINPKKRRRNGRKRVKGVNGKESEKKEGEQQKK